MKKIISIFLFSGIVIFAMQSCGGATTQPPAGDTAKQTVSASVDGKSLYEAKCVNCHGADGKAGLMGAADLSISKLDDATITATVKNGKQMMKGFGGELNDSQIEAVANYVKGLRR